MLCSVKTEDIMTAVWSLSCRVWSLPFKSRTKFLLILSWLLSSVKHNPALKQYPLKTGFNNGRIRELFFASHAAFQSASRANLGARSSHRYGCHESLEAVVFRLPSV